MSADHSSDVPVGSVFDALADDTRRYVYEAVVSRGPLTATVLASELPVSRQAISKHLERLAGAGLVASHRAGRETRWEARTAPLNGAAEWLERVGRQWDRRLSSLAGRVSRDAADVAARLSDDRGDREE